MIIQIGPRDLYIKQPGANASEPPLDGPDVRLPREITAAAVLVGGIILVV